MKESRVALTFQLLHQEVEQYIKHSNRDVPGVAERLAFWIGWAGAGFGLLAASTTPRWFSPESVLPLAAAGLLIEIAGFAISMTLMLRREIPKLWRARQNHAEEMDADFQSLRRIVDSLRKYPSGERLARLRFVNNLRSNMSYRLGLATGGIERLGIFPMLFALYLQFRDWKWGNWAALGDVNLVAGLLIWAMVLLYGAGWMLIGLKVRLDTYQSILEESLEGESI